MNRKLFYVVSDVILSAMLLLCGAPASGQTPGQIPKFDPASNVVDSVITEDAAGKIGIGTTTPAAALDVASGDLNLGGNVLKYGVPFIQTVGFANTFLGSNAGNLTMTFCCNTAIGDSALSNNNGPWNTASGYQALFGNIDGFNNVANGVQALYSNTSGSRNIASGAAALYSNTTGGNNVAIGDFALYRNISGYSNVASGDRALEENTTGSSNVAIGEIALSSNTTGSNNTAIGGATLFENTTGDNNIAIGYGAGQWVINGSHNIHIGHSAPVEATDSNTIRIGSLGTHSRFFAAGVRNAAVAGVPVLVDANGQLGVQASSRRFKDQVHDMAGASDGLRRLRPVTFYYKQTEPGGSPQLQYGLIAEEVAAVYPELVEYSDTGEPFTVRYHLLGAMLLNEVQKQDRQLQEQRQQIQAQAAQVAELQAQLAAIAGLLQQRDR